MKTMSFLPFVLVLKENGNSLVIILPPCYNYNFSMRTVYSYYCREYTHNQFNDLVEAFRHFIDVFVKQ